MIHKLTNRKALKTIEWLQQTVQQVWKLVEPPPNDLLKVQQFDFAANLNEGLVIQKIKDGFQSIVESADEPPTEVQRVGSDGQMAALLHKALDGLTPREASDPDLWAYLTCVGCPKYVRWRWNTPKADAFWTRLAGNTRRNALSRLWWWAEITHDSGQPTGSPERYAITKNVQGRQSLMLWLVDCAFSGQPKIVRELDAIQEAESLNDMAQKKICRTVNRLARVVCLDALEDDGEAKALCSRALQVSRFLAA
jgi:hypothetical protein